MNILESVRLHCGQRPINGGFEIRRAAKARAERIAQFGEPPVGKVRLGRRPDEFGRGGLIVGQLEDVRVCGFGLGCFVLLSQCARTGHEQGKQQRTHH